MKNIYLIPVVWDIDEDYPQIIEITANSLNDATLKIVERVIGKCPNLESSSDLEYDEFRYKAACCGILLGEISDINEF